MGGDVLHQPNKPSYLPHLQPPLALLPCAAHRCLWKLRRSGRCWPILPTLSLLISYICNPHLALLPCAAHRCPWRPRRSGRRWPASPTISLLNSYTCNPHLSLRALCCPQVPLEAQEEWEALAYITHMLSGASGPQAAQQLQQLDVRGSGLPQVKEGSGALMVVVVVVVGEADGLRLG